jgi:hypothetical protein
MTDDMRKQIAAMPLFVAQMRLNWATVPEPEKARYRAAWAEGLRALQPAAAPVAAAAPAEGGKKSVAEMMAEQNRRHNSYMSMSNAMMNSYKIGFNTQANFIGSSYRYW